MPGQVMAAMQLAVLVEWQLAPPGQRSEGCCRPSGRQRGRAWIECLAYGVLAKDLQRGDVASDVCR